MLTKIDDLPESVIGFTIHGALSADDYNNVVTPALDVRDAEDGIELLLVTGTDFLGTDLGSQIGAQQFRREKPLHIKKIALVTNNVGFAQGVQMFAMLANAEFKLIRDEFPDKDYVGEAVAWLEK